VGAKADYNALGLILSTHVQWDSARVIISVFSEYDIRVFMVHISGSHDS